MGAWRQSTARAWTIRLVRIRAPRHDDLIAVAALLELRPEFLRSDWELPSFELAGDAWLAAEGERLVGYAAVMAGERLVHSAADADVADALLARAAQRARARGFRTLSLASRGETDLVRRHPFELSHETLAMARRLDGPVDKPAWPAGIRARTFEPNDAESVHALLDEAYRAWDSRYVPIAHDDWLRWMTGDVDFDPTAWWLAERDGDLVGCALHWRTGWLKDLAVRTSERGRGLGTALVQQGLAEFSCRGVVRVGLKVDAANPTGAVHLYERLGFVVERREATWALNL
jgi:ribosomal protein S18 acetylase RimI-like enzyme